MLGVGGKEGPMLGALEPVGRIVEGEGEFARAFFRSAIGEIRDRIVPFKGNPCGGKRRILGHRAAATTRSQRRGDKRSACQFAHGCSVKPSPHSPSRYHVASQAVKLVPPFLPCQ